MLKGHLPRVIYPKSVKVFPLGLEAVSHPAVHRTGRSGKRGGTARWTHPPPPDLVCAGGTSLIRKRLLSVPYASRTAFLGGAHKRCTPVLRPPRDEQDGLESAAAPLDGLYQTKAGSNRLFRVSILYWRSPESDDMWIKSRQLKKAICAQDRLESAAAPLHGRPPHLPPYPERPILPTDALSCPN